MRSNINPTVMKLADAQAAFVIQIEQEDQDNILVLRVLNSLGSIDLDIRLKMTPDAAEYLADKLSGQILMARSFDIDDDPGVMQLG